MSTLDTTIQPPEGPAGPIGTPLPGQDGPGPDQTTVTKAWWQLMLRIGKHNPELFQSGGKALDTVNTLMRTHR